MKRTLIILIIILLASIATLLIIYVDTTRPIEVYEKIPSAVDTLKNK